MVGVRGNVLLSLILKGRRAVLLRCVKNDGGGWCSSFIRTKENRNRFWFTVFCFTYALIYQFLGIAFSLYFAYFCSVKYITCNYNHLHPFPKNVRRLPVSLNSNSRKRSAVKVIKMGSNVVSVLS